MGFQYGLAVLDKLVLQTTLVLLDAMILAASILPVLALRPGAVDDVARLCRCPRSSRPPRVPPGPAVVVLDDLVLVLDDKPVLDDTMATKPCHRRHVHADRRPRSDRPSPKKTGV